MNPTVVGTLTGTVIPSHSYFSSSTSGVKKEFTVNLGSFGLGIIDTRIMFSICDRLCKNPPCLHHLHIFTKTAVKS